MPDHTGIPVQGDVPPPLPYQRHDPVMEQIIPLKNPPALISYYTGWLSLLPVIGALFFVFALVYGFKGLAVVKKSGNRIGQVHAIIGIVFGCIAIPEQLLSVLIFAAVIWDSVD